MRIDAGSFRCHVVVDGTRTVSPRFVFRDYDAEVQGPTIANELGTTGRLPSRVACLAVEAPGGTILVDTGVGAGDTGFDGGHLHRELAAEGIHPWDVRHVVLTHGHTDHVGGVLDPRGDPVFRDARHFAHRTEVAFWDSDEAAALPRDAAVAARTAFGALLDADLLDAIDDDRDIAPGVRVIAAPGHTPGHLAVVIDDALLWSGDVFVHPSNIARPEWASAADMDPGLNVRTRRSLLARCAERGVLVAGSHMAAIGPVVAVGDGYAIGS